jgi:hypothetical protein
MMERNLWGSPSIMVWGGIGLNVKLAPVIFQNLGPGRGNGVTAARYIDQVLRPHVVPHFARHQNKTFQQDNVRVHTARATRDYLQQNSINVMNWPALSPDLNPIVESDATPYHDAWTAPKIPFHHAVVIISFSSPSP